MDAGAYLSAKEQVEYYWKKLNSLALIVTDTEVRLNLPNILYHDSKDFTKSFRYNLEGVVDIVSENGIETMYDLKTHGEADVKNEGRHSINLVLIDHQTLLV